MDKNAIKKYAVWARTELIDRVTQKALQYGITEKESAPASATNVNGVVLSKDEMQQRKALLERIAKKGYKHVIEEVAYTWFNRFSALRFMEVNGYLPSRIRVFTDENNQFKPQILVEAINLEMAGLDMEKVYEFKNANDDEGLFKYLIIVQCNALSAILPGMFQRISDYTELLFPDNLLRDGSAIQRMIEWIPEDNWKDAIQIIGWLYQFYNIEPKAAVFAKKDGKVSKEEIPAATQLFTPDWIVRYMVENSLGRLWIERNAASARDEYDEFPGDINEILVSKWKYFLFETPQEPEVDAQLKEIRKAYKDMSPEQIKCIDPCAGSGHILAYLFDVLMQIYESYGYTARDAVRSIIENNLYGLDIDDRAAQLAYFAVMMKARQYDRRFLTRKDENGDPDVPQPRVYAIKDSEWIGGAYQYEMGNFLLEKKHRDTLNYILEAFRDAKEYGSVLQLEDRDYVGLMDAWKYTASQTTENMNLTLWYSAVEQAVPELIEQAIVLSQKYDVVATNPPYMSVSNGSIKLQEYIKSNYPTSKTDLFSVFIECCGRMTTPIGYQSMITQQSWLSLPSFLALRKSVCSKHQIVSMEQLGSHSFNEISGEVVSSVAFCLRNGFIGSYIGSYSDLQEGMCEEEKERAFLHVENRYYTKQDSFSFVPNHVVSYDISPIALSHFSDMEPLCKTVVAKPGMQTSDNERFLRFWHEVSMSRIGFGFTHCEAMSCKYKWFPYNKGIGYRKWYGNNDYVVNFYNDGEELKYWLVHNPKDPGTKHWSRNMRNYDYYFNEGITFTAIGNSFSARINGGGYLFDTKGPTMFGNHLEYVCGFTNSCVFDLYNRILCKQITKSGDSVNLVPFVYSEQAPILEDLVRICIALSKSDWDSYETAWDFARHPLISVIPKNRMLFDDIGNIDLAECYLCWEQECTERFAQLKANEEELNRIFIDIYGLQDELTPEVEDKDITVRLADKKRDVKSLISYAVGCMFGRYSLNVEGLAYAGGEWDDSKYVTFKADKDSIIPICDDEYFADDIVGRFIRFIETVYGKRSLDANLRFIAEALGGSGQPKDVIRNYFLNDFYANHLKIYQKRPIYWLFDSGKKGGFKALVYMHRYQPDTIARMRTDYVHEQQARYRTAIADLEQRIASASTSERVKLSKRLKTLQEQATEIQGYEEKIHHLADQYIAIDLDDGVKVNYAKFQDVLAKIK